MGKLKTGGAKSLGDDPLALAALYFAGLGVKWKSQAEAAQKLTNLGSRVRRAQIQQAVAVSAFPKEVLALFSDVGMLHETARQLIRARNKIGITDLVSRAALVDPGGKSRTEIVAHLCGRESDKALRATYRTDSPLALYRRYVEGLRAKAWATMREAADAMGIAHSRIVCASAVANLPEELTSVLPADCLTFEMGRAIADLVAVRGVEAIRKEAVAARNLVPRLSPQRFLARLMGIDGSQFVAKVRRAPERRGRPGRLFVEIHLDATDPDSESRLELLIDCLNVEFAGRLAKAESGAKVSTTIVAPRVDPRGPYLAEQQRRLNRPAPLSSLSIPPHLSGSMGANRSDAVPPFGVIDDRSALEHWLSAYENPATRNRYRNEVERLLLWAVIAKRKPLSSIDVTDANEFINQFAVDPQPRTVWVMKGKRSRDEPTWRPFRGPLSHESRRKALERLRKCFDDLVLGQYLAANPFTTVNVDPPSL
ncbi:hypothetical protein OKW34_000109 [Paraburkholderia youngii]|uniref:hypothetical protein n=1 Tax=Paraburkholderia youngii TaxID=2782701 RepID=UPI003D21331D